MKKTKILLGALIAALAFGFASCKQEATVQDVNVVDHYKTYASYVCNATGTVTVSGTEYIVGSGIVYVDWTQKPSTDSNKTTYEIYGTLNVKTSAAATTFTQLSISDSGDIDTIVFTKLNGKFVEWQADATTGEQKYVDISSRFTGKPTDKSFTYTTEGLSLTITRL